MAVDLFYAPTANGAMIYHKSALVDQDYFFLTPKATWYMDSEEELHVRVQVATNMGMKFVLPDTCNRNAWFLNYALADSRLSMVDVDYSWLEERQLVAFGGRGHGKTEILRGLHPTYQFGTFEGLGSLTGRMTHNKPEPQELKRSRPDLFAPYGLTNDPLRLRFPDAPRVPTNIARFSGNGTT